MSSPVIFLPSRMVKDPTPGSTRFFRISVPVAVALMRHTLAVSRATWPWSPHSLNKHDIQVYRYTINIKVIKDQDSRRNIFSKYKHHSSSYFNTSIATDTTPIAPKQVKQVYFTVLPELSVVFLAFIAARYRFLSFGCHCCIRMFPQRALATKSRLPLGII